MVLLAGLVRWSSLFTFTLYTLQLQSMCQDVAFFPRGGGPKKDVFDGVFTTPYTLYSCSQYVGDVDFYPRGGGLLFFFLIFKFKCFSKYINMCVKVSQTIMISFIQEGITPPPPPPFSALLKSSKARGVHSSHLGDCEDLAISSSNKNKCSLSNYILSRG